MGNEAFQARKLDEALAHYDCALALDPHNLTVFCNKAVVLSKLGRHQEAIHLVRVAIDDARLHDASPETIARAYQKLAVVYNALNDLDGAIEALTASLHEHQDPEVVTKLRGLEQRRAMQKAQE
jgi:stress-induced-phosphoprotein 1